MTKAVEAFSLAKIQGTTLARDRSSALLDKNIKIFYRTKESSIAYVEASIHEIFMDCQKQLAANFHLQKFSIRGSSVAHLFSSEPYADIDIHGFIDLTHCTPTEAIKQGHSIKWKVLEVFESIICQKEGRSKLSGNKLDSLEKILFEDQFVALGTKKVLPFNIHTLRLGAIPLEFTFFAIVSQDFKDQRFFDFNCGALEILISDEDHGITLHSPLPDMDTVLEEISRRELRCESPTQLYRKSVCRYLSKVSISGYFDKDPCLLTSFLANHKERRGELFSDESVVDELLKEIETHFAEKNLNRAIPLINLYFFHSETPLLDLLKAKANLVLIDLLKGSLSDKLKVIGHLIEEGRFAEVAWYLLFQAKEIQHVSHRSKECLQIKIPLHAFFKETDGPQDSFYVILPIIDLWKFHSCQNPLIFLQLLEEDNHFESYSEKALISLRVMLTNIFIKHRLSAPLIALLTRLRVSINQTASDLILQELPSLTKVKEEPFPFELLVQLCNLGEPQNFLIPQIAFEVLKSFQKNVMPNKLFELGFFQDKVFVINSMLAVFKSTLLGDLDVSQRDALLQYIQTFLQDTFLKRQQGLSIDSTLLKKLIQISYLSYSKDCLTPLKALEVVELCYSELLVPQGCFYLKAILAKEESLEDLSLDKVLTALMNASLEAYLSFLLENNEVLKQKKEHCAYLFEAAFHKMCSNPLERPFGLFTKGYLTFVTSEEGRQLKANLLKQATLKDPEMLDLFETFKKRGLLELKEFINLEHFTKGQLLFLFQHKDFKEEILEDEGFAFVFIDKLFKEELFSEASSVLEHLIEFSKVDLYRLARCVVTLSDNNEFFLKSLLFLSHLSIDELQESDKEPILSQILLALDRFLSLTENPLSILSDTSRVSSIAHLHKKYFLKTFTHPVWPKVWNYLEEISEKYDFHEWINVEDLDCLILNGDPKGPFKALSMAFSMDHFFITHLFSKIKSFEEGRQEGYLDLIYLLLNDKSYQVFSDYPANGLKDKDSASLTLNLLAKLLAKSTQEKTSIEDVKKIMSLMLFSASFGDEEVRDCTLAILTSILSLEKSTFTTQLRETGIAEEVVLAIADKSFKERNFVQINKVNQVIKDLFIYEEEGKSYLKFKFSQLYKLPQLSFDRCEAWNKGLREIFSKKSQIEALKEDAYPLAALDYYCKYLTQVIVSFAHVIKSQPIFESLEELKYFQDIQKTHYLALYKLLDMLASKSFSQSIHPMAQLLSLTNYVDKEDMGIFLDKYLNYAAHQINFLPFAKMGSPEHDIALILLKHSAVLYAHYSLRLKGVKDPKYLITLLEATRNRVSCFTNDDHSVSADFLNILSYLEGFLKPEEALKYHEEWLQSIIRRASSVTFDEINLFTIFTYRCDPKFFTSIGSGVNSRLFTNKLFMNQAYFKNIATLKAFVTLFDIAFARFTEHFNLEEGDHRAMNLDVFSMLGVYNKFIYSGLDTLKNRAEATKIQIQFLEILSKSLTGRITPLTIHILQALWTYLISTNEVGIFCFKHRTRDQVSRNIAIFSQLINHLKILPKDFHRKHEIPIEQLMIAYEYHKPQFIKELSKAKNEEIWDFLTEKVTEDYIAMGRSLKVVSEVDDLAVFDGDLLAQIEKELLGSGPASKGAHP